MKRLDVIALHQRFVKQLPICGICEYLLVKHRLIRCKVFQCVGKLRRIDIPFLLHVDNTALLHYRNRFEAMLFPIQIREPALARNPFEGTIETIGPAVIGTRQRLDTAAARKR